MAAPLLSQGTMLQCVFGACPGTLNPLPSGPPVMVGNKLAGNIAATKLPETGIFGMCTSPANTATPPGIPAPCVTNAPAPWTPGNPLAMIAGKPAASHTSAAMCIYSMGPNIRPLVPGQIKGLT